MFMRLSRRCRVQKKDEKTHHQTGSHDKNVAFSPNFGTAKNPVFSQTNNFSPKDAMVLTSNKKPAPSITARALTKTISREFI